MTARAPATLPALGLALVLTGCGDGARDANDVSMMSPLNDRGGNTSVTAGNGNAAAPARQPVAADALARAGVATAIPARFQGVYDQDADGCRAASSVFRLRVEPRTLRFHESMGEVRTVTADGANAIRVAAAYSGEGMDWSSSQRLALDENDGKLIITGEGAPFTRVRC